MTKRKPVQPRKTVRPKMVQVHVVPRGRWRWAIQVNGEEVGTTRRQDDAADIAVLLAKLMTSASVKLHDRKGRVLEESTFPRSADPRRSRG